MAMWEFFKLDDDAVNSVEDALIDHGEEGAMGLAARMERGCSWRQPD